MILDVAEHERDLVKVVEVVDHFQFGRRCGVSGGVRTRCGEGRAKSRDRSPQHAASMHGILHLERPPVVVDAPAICA